MKWKPVALSPKLWAEIEEFCRLRGVESVSEAIQVLVTKGLDLVDGGASNAAEKACLAIPLSGPFPWDKIEHTATLQLNSKLPARLKCQLDYLLALSKGTGRQMRLHDVVTDLIRSWVSRMLPGVRL
jgi:hypothetical protein